MLGVDLRLQPGLEVVDEVVVHDVCLRRERGGGRGGLALPCRAPATSGSHVASGSHVTSSPSAVSRLSLSAVSRLSLASGSHVTSPPSHLIW